MSLPKSSRGKWFTAALAVIGLAAMVVLLSNCGGGGGAPEPQFLQLADASGRALTDVNGNQIPDIPQDSRPTVMTAVTGFPPKSAVEVQILRNGIPLTDPRTGDPLILQLTTDEKGNVPRFPLWDLGVDPQTGQAEDATGVYTVVATAQGKQVTVKFEVISGRATPAQGRQATTGTLLVLAGNPPRHPMGSVAEGEPVGVEGFGFPANQQVKVFVVRDVENWQSGAPLTDQSGGAETVTINAQGEMPRTIVWGQAQRLGTAQTDGDFDVVVDVNRNDRYDSGTDVVNGMLGTCFTVQATSRGRQAQGHLAVELAASTQQGRFKDHFDVRENVGVWVNPPWRPLMPGRTVRKYVVLHKDNWQDGDDLLDVTGRPEWDLVRYACANQYVCPVWFALLTPGKYDVIIDVDANGKYTLGTDYIDAGLTEGGEQVGAGFIVTGTPPPIRLVLSTNLSTVNNGESVEIIAQLQDDDGRPVSNATVNFSIVSGQGGQLSDTSKQTGQNGITTVRLTATQPNTTLVIQGVATRDDRTATAEVSVRVRAPGELSVIIR